MFGFPTATLLDCHGRYAQNVAFFSESAGSGIPSALKYSGSLPLALAIVWGCRRNIPTGVLPVPWGLKKNQPATVKVTVNQGRAQSWCRGSLEVEWEWLGTWNSVPSLNKNKVGDEGDTKETGISVNRLIFKAHSESQIQGKILPVGADEAWYSVACLLIPALWESKAGDFRCRPSLDNLVI